MKTIGIAGSRTRSPLRRHGTPSLVVAVLGALLARPAAAASSCPSAPTKAAMGSRLGIAIEFHVENSLLGSEEETDYVLELSAAARDAGVTVTFGLGRDLLDDYADDPDGDGYGTDGRTGIELSRTLAEVVAAIRADCQEVGLHADVNETMSADDVESLLRGYLSQLRRAGARTAVASGVCNETSADATGGWLEAARRAGLRGVAGVVTYCQGSLDPANAHWIDPGSCSPSFPTYCHFAAPEDDATQRVGVWRANATSSWIDPAARGRVAIIGGIGTIDGFAQSNLPCLAETDARRSCTGYSNPGDADLDAASFVARVQAAERDARTGTVGDTAYQTFSTNVRASGAYVSAIFQRIVARLAETTSASGAALSDVTAFVGLRAVERLNR